jgi:hypothetical protein
MGIHNEVEIDPRKEEFSVSFAPHKVFWNTGQVLNNPKDPMIGLRAVLNNKVQQ